MILVISESLNHFQHFLGAVILTIKQKEQQKERGLGGKRCVRKSISMTNDTEFKLKKLAISCDMSPAELASYILEKTLNNPEAVTNLQKRFNKHEQYWCYPVSFNGKIQY